jgi:hypothetical protein
MTLASITGMDARRTVAEALLSFRTAMMVTHATSGPFDVRPMHVAAVDIAFKPHSAELWRTAAERVRYVLEPAADHVRTNL